MPSEIKTGDKVRMMYGYALGQLGVATRAVPVGGELSNGMICRNGEVTIELPSGWRTTVANQPYYVMRLDEWEALPQATNALP